MSGPIKSGWDLGRHDDQVRQCLAFATSKYIRLEAEVAALQAENERLRKAGDGLMFEGETMAHEVSWNPAPWDRVVAAWVAAKEGGRK